MSSFNDKYATLLLEADFRVLSVPTKAKTGVGKVRHEIRFVRASVANSYHAQPRISSDGSCREPVFVGTSNFAKLEIKAKKRFFQEARFPKILCDSGKPPLKIQKFLVTENFGTCLQN